MRVLLDTNILARAAGPYSGVAREVLNRVVAPPHMLILSQFILSELGRVLHYEHIRRLHVLDEDVFCFNGYGTKSR